jgi:ubiquinone biosynthesis monooxygenase Coq7
MIDALIPEFDKALRALFAPAPTRRPMPGADLPEAEMNEAEKRHVAALMRVNHCGEICAQALYQGQALGSSDPAVRQELEQAAWEETEHLNWTETRIAELGRAQEHFQSAVVCRITGYRGCRREVRR